MKISLAWLRQLIDLPESITEIATRLTASGLEVEGVAPFELVPGGLAGLVIGEVRTCAPHPDADKLRVTTVDIGTDTPAPIVCGAPNVAAGQKVVVATVGTTLYPQGGEPFKIKKAKIRGEVSEGMICAEDEIGLGAGHDGILVLDTDLPNGTPAAQYFQLETDDILEIGLTPNRADAASHLGVARDLRALLGRPLRMPTIAPLPVADTHRPFRVAIADPAACRRYAGLTLTDLTVGPSPEWLQRRLRSIGLTPINNVVDVTNYVMHELGQPLHAFDADRLRGDTLTVQTVAAGTTFVTLDETERHLHIEDLLICDGEGPVALAGVFGGAHSGVHADTRTIFLESACFGPATVRRMAQRHALRTDASFRFERGTDPDMVLTALHRAADLLHTVAGARRASEVVDVYPQPEQPFAVRLSYLQLDQLVGYAIPQERVVQILADLDIDIWQQNEEWLDLRVPPYRVDVRRPADVIEEIVRIYGYDQIPLPDTMGSSYLANFPKVDTDQVRRDVSQVLAGLGYHEIVTNSLTRRAYAVLTRETAVPILNPLSEDLDGLRTSLLYTGLEVLAHNVNRRQTDLKCYEFGRTYAQTADGAVQERVRLALLVTGDRQAESWQIPSAAADFHTLAAAVGAVAQRLGIAQPTQTPATHPLLAYGLTLGHRRTDFATLGLVAPALARDFGVRQAVFFAELDWQWLVGQFRPEATYREVSRFPEVRRDLSLVLDRRVSFEEVRQVAQRTERRLLQQINVFDVYEGEKLGADKKSYSVSFLLQDVRQTLTDAVIDRTMQQLIVAFERELGAIIRK